MARARESVVTLEYAAVDGPADSRRVATGVVINKDGDVLSVRIDRPTGGRPADSAGPTATALDRSWPVTPWGDCHIARWVAADQESGLTLLRISPRTLRPIKSRPSDPCWEARSSSSAIRSAWGIRSAGGTSPGLTAP